MEIKLAEEMGFCFGVRKAIELVEQEAQKRVDTRITTFGQLVHNPVVVNRMEKLGVGAVENRDWDKVPGGTLAFTAHGVAPDVFEEARARGLEVMDATCPLVSLIQQSAQNMVKEGYRVIVYGDPKHPEVKSIVGWSGSPDTFATLNFEDVKNIRPPKRLGIVSQSTQILEHFREFVAEVNKHFLGKTKEIKVHNTICAPTTRLQGSAKDLAQECQVMIVIGGKLSANTQHLADICLAEGATTYKIEQADELDPTWFKGIESVGVTAGASTPDESIEAVVAQLKAIDLMQQVDDAKYSTSGSHQ
jgi:(E)-4-hydroxy-3-methyl-but-2-enyl pyrophosphate reductase